MKTRHFGIGSYNNLAQHRMCSFLFFKITPPKHSAYNKHWAYKKTCNLQVTLDRQETFNQQETINLKETFSTFKKHLTYNKHSTYKQSSTYKKHPTWKIIPPYKKHLAYKKYSTYRNLTYETFNIQETFNLRKQSIYKKHSTFFAKNALRDICFRVKCLFFYLSLCTSNPSPCLISCFPFGLTGQPNYCSANLYRWQWHKSTGDWLMMMELWKPGLRIRTLFCRIRTLCTHCHKTFCCCETFIK